MKSNAQELAWLAFRYVSGELSPSETTGFELRLADDQVARDAVVAAVELSQSVLAAEAQSASPASCVTPASTSQQPWSAHVVWLACSAAACLVIALAVNFSTSQQRSIAHAPADAAALAAAWHEQLDEPLALNTSESTSSESDNSVGDDTASDDSASTDSDSGDLETAATDAPSWMLDAVHLLHGERLPAEGTTDDDDSHPSPELES